VGVRSVDDLLIDDRRLRPEALPVTEPAERRRPPFGASF
jgi:hypothetical protein